MKFRRGRTKVLFDMLCVVQEANGKCRSTQILYKANLSHKLLKQYLQLLIASNFLVESKERGIVYYKLTEEGQNFINEFRKVEKLATGFGLPI